MRYADVPASAVNAVTAALSVRFREVLILARCDLLAESRCQSHTLSTNNSSGQRVRVLYPTQRAEIQQ